MARFLLLVALIVASLTLARADTQPCNTAQTITLNGTDGVYGCYGANAYVTTNFIFTKDFSRNVDILFTGWSDMTLTFYVGTTILYGPFNPYQTLSYFFPAGQEVKAVYYAGGTTQSSYQLTFTVTNIPGDVYTLISDQPKKISTSQSGGFVYFLLPPQSNGKMFALDVELSSYQGLREPSVYVSRNRVPTLDRYDYTNDTVSTGPDTETCLLFIQNPYPAAYVVGVFLYGTSASMSVQATWTFNIDRMSSGVRVSKQNNGIDYYQIFVNNDSPKLVFQISRQAPGGFPVAWIAQGVVPSAVKYDYIADTKTQSYISISIPNPNPTNNTGPNPGNYIFAISSGGQTSGYIIQADW